MLFFPTIRSDVKDFKQKNRNYPMTTKNLTLINFIIVAYFSLLWLINLFKIEHVAIGFLAEMLTIPFLLAQIIFLFLGIRAIIQHKKDILLIISVFLLFASAVLTIGSFF
jgi:hypothetical protein